LKIIGISQRVELFSKFLERRDSLDQNWSSLFESIGLNLVPIPNGLKNLRVWVKNQRLEGILLSGGNDLSAYCKSNNAAPERDTTEIELLNIAIESNLSVLGVCRGMQMINHFLGGNIIPVDRHTNTNHLLKINTKLNTFKIFSKVNSFHNWGIRLSDLADDLEPLLLAEDETVEAFRHKFKPWYGIMWHPERSQINGPSSDMVLLSKIFKQTKK